MAINIFYGYFWKKVCFLCNSLLFFFMCPDLFLKLVCFLYIIFYLLNKVCFLCLQFCGFFRLYLKLSQFCSDLITFQLSSFLFGPHFRPWVAYLNHYVLYLKQVCFLCNSHSQFLCVMAILVKRSAFFVITYALHFYAYRFIYSWSAFWFIFIKICFLCNSHTCLLCNRHTPLFIF